MPTLALNKRASYEYEILETFEAGLVLEGHEVKSTKNGGMKIAEAYVIFKHTSKGMKRKKKVAPHSSQHMMQTVWEPYLLNAHIARYKPAGTDLSYNPTRSRKLLLQKKEITSLTGKLSQRGLTMIPLKVYTHHALVKLSFGLARGKKKYDKRRTIREREVKRHIANTLKNPLP